MYFFSLQNFGFPTNWILFHINVVIIAQHFPTVLLAEKSDSSRNMSSQTKVMHFLKSHTFEEEKAQMLGKTVAAGLHVFSFTVYRQSFAADSPCAISSCRKKKSAYFYCLKVGWLDILSKLSIYFFLSVILSNFFSFFIETLVLPLSVIVFFFMSILQPK